MSKYQTLPIDRDPVLWDIARKRAGFKKHATVYTIVNIFLWALWFFISNAYDGGAFNSYPWPIRTTLGWGIGLTFHFMSAYVFPKMNLTEKEYQKLKNNQLNNQ